MALREDEPKYPPKTLITIGIPAFLLAVLISVVTHQYAHFIVDKIASKQEAISSSNIVYIDFHGMSFSSPVAAAAGPAWTFLLALISFGFYLHNPRNLFAAAMAFVNASARLPETITVFLQLLIHNKTTLLVDESFSLALFKLTDPTISIICLCFFSLTILFLTIIIIHDTKMIPWKWLVAIILFITMIPLEYLISNAIAPFIT
jgi:hypothetical protein